ncbi:hypothetical protein [Priestia sp. YIM B13489]|uniref:hypothetical protein n=1 Tax=Priestia sp. YIM B13489 TaxID=3366313 RepID=UPI00366C35C2
MEKENKYLVTFLHLPKTGGTTLRNILRTQYLPEEILDLPSTNDFIDWRILQKNKKIKCIWAHVHLGIYLEIPFEKKFSLC